MKYNTDDLIIRRLTGKDITIAKTLFKVLQEVFEEEKTGEVSEGHIIRLLNNSAFVCLVAIYKNEVIGGLTAYDLPMYNSEKPELFIYDIAIKPHFQRLGFGKELMNVIKDYCAKNSIKQLFVDANEEDTHALDFYRSMNGREEKVVQFTFDNPAD